MHVSSTDGCPTFVLYHRFPGVWCSPSSSTQPLPLTARVKGYDLKGKNTASRSYTDDATCEGSALADFLSLFAKPYMEFQSLSFLTINIITLYLQKRCVNSMEEVTGSTWFCEPRRTCVHLFLLMRKSYMQRSNCELLEEAHRFCPYNEEVKFAAFIWFSL